MVRAASSVDAIALLKQDHRTVEALFERFEKSRSKDVKQRLAHQICMELSVHTRIEEEIFYPAVTDGVEEDVLDEAYVEHDGAKALIAEIMASDQRDEFYDAKVKVLSEMIKHHVKEEEQRGGMFSQARDSDADLKALGELMASRKKELTAEYEARGIPTPVTLSMVGARVERGQRAKLAA